MDVGEDRSSPILFESSFNYTNVKLNAISNVVKVNFIKIFRLHLETERISVQVPEHKFFMTYRFTRQLKTYTTKITFLNFRYVTPRSDREEEEKKLIVVYGIVSESIY